MTRGTSDPVGGGAVGVSDGVEPAVNATSITARANGYGNLDYLRTGRYHDLASDGRDISPTTDTIVWTDVPPGNSYEPAHYAEDPGETVSQSSSELVAAVIQLEGQMRDSVEADFTWTRPDGEVAWEGGASIRDPSEDGYEWWETVYFYTWIGRGFEQGAEPEITEPGTYTVEFDTNYGTYSEDVELIGLEVTSCQLPSGVPYGGSDTGTVSVRNSSGRSFSGDVVVAEPMTSSKTNRSDLEITRQGFSIDPNTSKDVTVEISSDPIGDLGDSKPVEVYVET